MSNSIWNVAREYGADDIVDFEEGDPVKQIHDLTDGEGVDAAIEALGTSATFEQCVKVTKAGGTVSNVGYHGEGENINIPREEWGVGMAEKDIATGLCPGGRLRLERLMRLLENDRLDPTHIDTRVRLRRDRRDFPSDGDERRRYHQAADTLRLTDGRILVSENGFVYRGARLFVPFF